MSTGGMRKILCEMMGICEMMERGGGKKKARGGGGGREKNPQKGKRGNFGRS